MMYEHRIAPQFLSVRLTHTELFSPEPLFPSKLPDEIDCRRNHRGGDHGADHVIPCYADHSWRAARLDRRCARVRVRPKWSAEWTDCAVRLSPRRSSAQYIRRFNPEITNGDKLALWEGTIGGAVAPSGDGQIERGWNNSCAGYKKETEEARSVALGRFSSSFLCTGN